MTYRLQTSIPRDLPEFWERFREYVWQTEPTVIPNCKVGTTETPIAHGLGEVPGWVGIDPAHCLALVGQTRPADTKCVYLQATVDCVVTVHVRRAGPLGRGEIINGGFEWPDWAPITTQEKPFDPHFFVPEVLIGGATLAAFAIEVACSFPAGLTGAVGKAGSAATSESVITIKKNGSNVGTVTFAAAGTTATFAAASAITLAVGDVLQFVNQATADATLADVAIALKGVRT